MEAAAALSLSFTNPRWPLRIPSSSLSVFSPRAPISPPLPVSLLRFQKPQTKQSLHLAARKERSWSTLRSSAADSPPSNSSERWILEPAGDGDCRHIGFKVPLPNAFEIASNVVTVGRLPEKADMVISVATVSGLHARLEKKEGTLLVTDLDSTNGTYINDKKLRPGAITIVSPGSLITFGDIHLAMFRVSKIEEADTTNKTVESETKAESDVPSDILETAS